MSEELEAPFPRPLSGAALDRPPSGMVPARQPLEGKVVTLEPLDPARHGAELYEASHGSDESRRVWDYLPDGPWPDAGAFDVWLRDMAAAFEYVFFAIRPKASGRASGMASYLDIRPRMGVIEIGYIWFAPGLQRTREATEALFLMLAYAMDDLAYRRMQWRCNSLNEKSRAAARRLGFRFEGIFYNHYIVKGRNRDTAWYSILDDEWPEVREIIQTWLGDETFDGEGRARRSLSAMMGQRSPSARG
jgi:RimJ/RimL family protein N-acetyltransferase